MKKTITALMIAGLLSAASATTVLAEEFVGMNVFNPLWPVATALSIPASIISHVISPWSPSPIVLPTLPAPAPVYAPPRPVYEAPPAYDRPAPGRYYYDPENRVYRRAW